MPRQKGVLVGLVALLILCARASADVADVDVRIDFSDSSAAPAATDLSGVSGSWNVVTSVNSMASPVAAIDYLTGLPAGTATYQFTRAGGGTWGESTGQLRTGQTFAGVTWLDSSLNAVRDSVGGGDQGTITVQFAGLDNSLTYSIQVVSSNSNSYAPGAQPWTVNNGSTINWSSYYDGYMDAVGRTFSWSGISPVDGVITIRETCAHNYATCLNAVRLSCYSPRTITNSNPLPNAMIGAAYNTTLVAADGVAPYTWSVLSGSLPDGLTLSSDGVISGTPTTAGTASFTVQATDSKGISCTAAFDLTVKTSNDAPVANAGADQVVDLPAAATLSGSAADDGLPNPPGTVSYSWTKDSGPGTVTFGDPSAATTIATFSTGGVYVLRLTASDSVLSSYDTVTVVANGLGADVDVRIDFSNKSAAPAATDQNGVAGTWNTVTAEGGPTAPLDYVTGLTDATVNGTITYTLGHTGSGSLSNDSSGNWNTANAGPLWLDSSKNAATDAMRGSNAVGFLLTFSNLDPNQLYDVEAVCSYKTSSYVDGTNGLAYKAVGNTTVSYNWKAYANGYVAGQWLSWLQFQPAANGTIVLSSQGYVGSTSGVINAIRLHAQTTPPSITTTGPLPDALTGAAYSQTLAAANGVAPYTWSILSGSLPAGLTLSSSGVLSGTPTATGPCNFIVLVTDSSGHVGGKAFSMTVYQTPQITTQPQGQTVTVGDNVALSIVATGWPTPTYQWRKNGTDISGATGTSLTFNSAALTDNGSYVCVVSNSGGTVTSNTAVLTVNPVMPPSTDMVRVTDKSGTAQTNYPLQFARPFVQGEIADYPQVLINGNPVLTQADVKQRWPDGSVKHAILSVVVPSISANGTVTLTFQNQASGNNTPLSQADMLGAAYDFDAGMQIVSGGVTRSASARQMLSDGNFTYWAQGPVATTIILADHSTARIYDMGFDDLRSIRPIFEVTFWPGINKVRVRFISEDSCTEALEDLVYDVVLTTGYANPQTVYTYSGYVHKAAARWTKVFWLGGTPEPKINVDSNLAYIEKTRFVPMYDASLTVPESTLAADYARWLTTPRDIQDSGWWYRGMGSTGGRDDIGHMPRWMAQWLYTGDWRAKEIAFGHADLAGNWSVHVREGNNTKFFDRAQTIPALGKPVSICARPQLWIFDERGGTNPSYWIPIYGTRLDVPGDAWAFEEAHQPDPFTIEYVLTGEHWYLEQLQMWTTYGALGVWPSRRGPAGYAGIVDQVRGDAWIFRTRINAAFVSPDNTPEQDYFKMMVDDALAHWEGWHGVAGNYTQHRLWSWAKSRIGVPNDGLNPIPPLRFFDSEFTAPWQNGFVMMELGVAREMGFASDPMASWHGQFITGQFLDPTWCVYRCAGYYLPVRKPDGSWLNTWTESEQQLVANGNTDEEATAYFRANAADPNDGYAVIASAAGAMNSVYPQADIAWSFLKTNVRDNHVAIFSANPKWAIVPRSQILQVGEGKTYATVQAAVDAASNGDVIQVFSGTYTQGAGWANVTKNNLRFIGMGSSRPVIDAAGSSLNGQGIFVISGHNTTVENIEFANAKNMAAGNAAGIRLQGRNLTINGCSFHDCDNGLVADAISDSTVRLDSSEFNHNGHGDGLSHNISVGAIDSFGMKYCWVHNANGGCEVKTLAKTSQILYSRIGNEGGNGTYEVQLANGGTTWFIGNQVEQSATGTNNTMLAYGNEGSSPDMHLYVTYNTFVNNNTDGTFVNNASSTSALLQDNIFQGTGTVLSGPGTQTTNWATTNAGLRNPAQYDFRLTPASTGAIGTGTSPGTLGSMSLVSSYRYAHPCGGKQRAANTATDIGAYEHAPAIVVNAGPAQSIFLPAAANLSGSATGGDGPLTYTWSKTSGPGTVTFADPAAPSTTATFSASGVYVLQLLATDTVLSSTGTVTVKVDPPGDITDLAAGDPAGTHLTLTWTAPGDVGTTGTAASYDIRYSTSNITDANFASATQLASPPTPAVAGSAETVTIHYLIPDTTYYFAIKTTNHVGTVSGLSNIASAASPHVDMTIVAIKRDAGLSDGRALAPHFSDAVTAGTINVLTGSAMIADCGSLSSNTSWAPQDIYRNYGITATAASGLPILMKFGLGSVVNLAGSTINRAELRFYTGAGNSGLFHTGYITFSDWFEGPSNGGFPGAAGGVSGAHPMGYNTGAYQAADGTPAPLNTPGFASWANGQPFAPSKDGVSVVTGISRHATVTAGTSDQWLTIDVTPILQLWASGTTNYGLFIDSTGNYYPSLSETTVVERQPTLFIEYYTVVDP